MKKIIPIIASTAVSAAALADGNSGFYGTVGAGVYRLESQSFDDYAPSMRLLGGYSFSEFVALETSYTRLFETADSLAGTRAKIEGNVWELGTRLSYPLSPRFSPYARLGYSYVDSSAAIIDNGERFRLNDYDNAFSWALGTKFSLSNRLDLYGEYSGIDIDGGDLNSLSANISYRFNAR